MLAISLEQSVRNIKHILSFYLILVLHLVFSDQPLLMAAVDLLEWQRTLPYINKQPSLSPITPGLESQEMSCAKLSVCEL